MAVAVLQVTNPGEQLILDYINQNATESLIDKINNGIHIIKDNIDVISKKTMDSFMKYASNKARESAPKGANCAYVSDIEVCGWAMHYFEEDSIEGSELFNLDGTKYVSEHKSTYTPSPQKQLSDVEIYEAKIKSHVRKELKDRNKVKSEIKDRKIIEIQDQVSLFDLLW